ncbi:MAG: hypothetical protein IPN66_06140 [Candidatus Competibacteraceae bacterium]|nr:hypothetical protein [Candidatus Competibacteraceae bacterium]
MAKQRTEQIAGVADGVVDGREQRLDALRVGFELGGLERDARFDGPDPLVAGDFFHSDQEFVALLVASSTCLACSE